LKIHSSFKFLELNALAVTFQFKELLPLFTQGAIHCCSDVFVSAIQLFVEAALLVSNAVWTPQMEAARSSKTLAATYKSTRRCYPED
jgi:hypothetical protein